MTTKNNKKKNNSARKIIPAAGMLMVSALMLSTSTYAWFTMSREVEVQNIKMTATVPEDTQISLGALNGVTAENGLAGGYGTLAFSGTKADNDGVTAPDDTPEYWANTVDISKYYALGKIIPASSTTGLNLYYTPDAAGVGKTLKVDAKYYKAVEGATAAGDGTGSTAGTGTLETTLHAYTAKNGTTPNDTWYTNYDSAHVKALTYDVTNDDGYYVDIPVWIRTSSSSAVTFAVDAYVTTDVVNDEDDLYLAARAVVLDSTKASTSNLIEIRNGSYASNESIVNFLTTTNNTGEAVDGLDSTDTTKATYNTKAHYDGSAVVTLDGANLGTGSTYGEGKKVYIRVWLEGEDPNCWNDNAGQDFSINLKFTRDDLSTTGYGTTDPQTNAWSDAGTALTAGSTINVTMPGNGTMVFAYDGTNWSKQSGMFPAIPMGKVYGVKDASPAVPIASEGDIISYLTNNINTHALAASGIEIEATDAAKPAAIQATVATTTGETQTTTVTYSATLPTDGVSKYTVGGKDYTTKTDLETALKAADGTYVVTITYTS